MKVKIDLPYPEVKVEEKNTYYADLLSQDYAGVVSESTAVMQYSYQHFDKSKENKEFAEIIAEIAEVEMKHLELLGETIKLLGKEPVYKTCESERGDCVFWSAKNVNYKTDLKDMLKSDINSEKGAIKNYENHKRLIKDKYIKNMLDRIILDEKRHLEIFNNIYDGLFKK
ncbi:MAG TPA: manganese catalase family protein [Candidatus Aphodocola excrementigallinarum]|uniref:Manganese catalase family protein n=1 Tax=Candidatus Aphodocola excrementigallinarum TaxID=2840670 RepID=A0A9D1LHX8_9FIRM|nr:manganese catalase family protein [Candidatus Aphodocola excrementigallinarum]